MVVNRGDDGDFDSSDGGGGGRGDDGGADRVMLMAAVAVMKAAVGLVAPGVEMAGGGGDRVGGKDGADSGDGGADDDSLPRRARHLHTWLWSFTQRYRSGSSIFVCRKKYCVTKKATQPARGRAQRARGDTHSHSGRGGLEAVGIGTPGTQRSCRSRVAAFGLGGPVSRCLWGFPRGTVPTPSHARGLLSLRLCVLRRGRVSPSPWQPTTRPGVGLGFPN